MDFGCGVGTSTRVLSEAMPGARRLIGMDLSPYMIAVGNHHNRQQKVGRRVSLVYGDVADTHLPEGTASLVSCTYLLHEMPDDAVRCAQIHVTLRVAKFNCIYLSAVPLLFLLFLVGGGGAKKVRNIIFFTPSTHSLQIKDEGVILLSFLRFLS